MIRIIISLLIVLCATHAFANEKEQPEWVKAFIAQKEAGPVENPPGSLSRCTYQGKTVYYYPPVCCDQMSELYDAEGKHLCAPDGGMTGGGDGKCADFYDTRTDCEVIWKDSGRRELSLKGVKAFQKLCEKSGGIFMDCAAAFTQLCADAISIDGRDVICSCPENSAWDADKGCVAQTAEGQ